MTLGLAILIGLATAAWQLRDRSNLATAARPAPASTHTYGRMPLSFEANHGQTDCSVNFLARGAGYALFLKPTEAVLALRSADSGLRFDYWLAKMNSFSLPGEDVRSEPVARARAVRAEMVKAFLSIEYRQRFGS